MVRRHAGRALGAAVAFGSERLPESYYVASASARSIADAARFDEPSVWFPMRTLRQ